jgi:hypothetical protein
LPNLEDAAFLDELRPAQPYRRAVSDRQKCSEEILNNTTKQTRRYELRFCLDPLPGLVQSDKPQQFNKSVVRANTIERGVNAQPQQVI